MKAQNRKELNNIIGDMTTLEKEIAQHSYFVGSATVVDQERWFFQLTLLGSRLNEIYHAERPKKKLKKKI